MESFEVPYCMQSEGLSPNKLLSGVILMTRKEVDEAIVAPLLKNCFAAMRPRK